MFTNLPAQERTAFFSLLDEYFTSRPHYLPSASASSSSAAATSTTTTTAPPGGVTLTASDLQKVGRIGRGLVAGATQNQAAQPPVPPARGAGGAAPAAGGGAAGLTSSKAFGKISTASASAALGSVLGNRNKVPAAAAPAPGASSSPLPPPRNTGAPLPPPSRSVAGATAATPAKVPEPEPAAANEETEGLGWAKGIYEYAGTAASDLSVAEGEEVWLVKILTGGEWYQARSADGQREGMVPCNYVERI